MLLSHSTQNVQNAKETESNSGNCRESLTMQQSKRRLVIVGPVSCKDNSQRPKSAVSALICLSLIPLLSGCGNAPAQLMPPLPVPSSLFTPCAIPDYNVVNYGDYPGYVASLMGVIEQCNNQIFAIKKVEEIRQTESTRQGDKQIVKPE